MPVRKFALRKEEARRLEIQWKGSWNDINVMLDGQIIGNIPDQDALKEGRDFFLKDGSHLKISLSKRLGIPELDILLNGEPIVDSDTNPERRMRTAAGLLFFIAGINLLVGSLAAFFHVEFLRKLGFGVELVVCGFIYLALGFGTRAGSKLALGAGIFIFAVDGILSIVMLSPQMSSPPTASIVVRIFILVQLITAFRKAPAKAA